MGVAAIISFFLLLYCVETALALLAIQYKGISLIEGGGTTNSQLHWSLSVENSDCGERGSFFSVHKHSSTIASDRKSHDLTSPREWLEVCESKDGNGAYTVMRCDYRFHEEEFQLWGKDFHMNRLDSSFAVLSPTNGGRLSNRTREKSEDTITLLLKHAKEECQEINDDNGESFCTFMVTILWQPNIDDVKVRGHIFSSLTPADRTSILSSNLLTAAIALGPGHLLPNRFQNSPEAKLIAWCRLRRPLEETFKTNGMAEVLMTRKRENHVEILEGLTSNLFVLYPENVLRTPATDAVLGGYARHLAIEAAKNCGLIVEIGPIVLDEAPLWREVFVTSSIRVIGPLGEIVLSDAKDSKKTLWRLKDAGRGREDGTSSLVCEQLLVEIFKMVG